MDVSSVVFSVYLILILAVVLPFYILIVKVLKRLVQYLDLKIIESEMKIDKDKF